MVACGIALIRGEIDHPNKSSADPFDAAQIHHRLKPQHHFLQLTPRMKSSNIKKSSVQALPQKNTVKSPKSPKHPKSPRPKSPIAPKSFNQKQKEPKAS